MLKNLFKAKDKDSAEALFKEWEDFSTRFYDSITKALKDNKEIVKKIVNTREVSPDSQDKLKVCIAFTVQTSMTFFMIEQFSRSFKEEGAMLNKLVDYYPNLITHGNILEALKELKDLKESFVKGD